MSTPTVRLALIGMGRMGRALDALARERGCEVVARLDVPDMSRGLTREMLNGAQVAIEFTQPDAAVANASACLACGCPVVIGTTGWGEQRATLEDAISKTGVPALSSPNFSLGVQLFLAIAEDAGRRLREMRGFDGHLVETHHTAKKDAPSGTAIAIAERVERGLGHAIPVSSIRVGSVPGTHSLVFDAPFEQITLTHEARDRRVFADGALAAARWLSAVKAPSLYSMQDVLTSPRDVAASGASGALHEG